MEDIRKIAKSHIWNQGKTNGVYGFPLPTNRDFMTAGQELAVGVPEDNVYILNQFYCDKSPESHIGPYKWAIDFLVPDGTDILAAETGRIIQVCDEFTQWGDSELFRDQLNFVTIQHENNELSQYCHLEPRSFKASGFKVGDTVKKGEVIGKVGKTGWTDRDHLHFIVFKVSRIKGNPYNFFSLQIRFEK